MCGVPYHSCDSYIARLIAKGYKVAICEQTEGPGHGQGAGGPGHHPGHHSRHRHLPLPCWREGRNNFLCAVYADSTALGLCLCDISTGEVFATSFPSGRGGPAPSGGTSWAASTPPRRCCPTGPGTWRGLTGFLREKLGCLCENGGEGPLPAMMCPGPRWRASSGRGWTPLPEGDRAAVQATGGLLSLSL